MQHMLSLFRSCVDDYDMIQENDRIAVGVSGGKDSLTLLVLLAELKKFYPRPFTLEAFPWTWAWGAWTFPPWRSSAKGWTCHSIRSKPRSARCSSSIGRRRIPAPSAPRCAGGPWARPSPRRGSTRSPWAITGTTRWRPC